MKKINNKLKKIFDKQEQLQKYLGNFPLKGLKNTQEFINLQLLSCFDELGEIMRETAWKNPKYIKYGWKKNQEFNEEKFKEYKDEFQKLFEKNKRCEFIKI